MSVGDIRKRLNDLEKAVESDSTDASGILIEIKIALTKLSALQPNSTITENLLPEIELARDVYEVAALLCVKQGDDTGFERHMNQAKTYYVDYAGILPPSSKQSLILALNLLRLLSHNKIANFHTELELIPQAARADPYIAYALSLERYLMEGAYAKMRDQRLSAMPHPSFAHFVDGLLVTVTDEIAACCERAYEKLSLDVAKELLNVEKEEDVLEIAKEREWTVKDKFIVFGSVQVGQSMDQVPSEVLIKRSLEYAKELEQII